MDRIVDFYFDFSSPYGYFSSEMMDDFAQRCDCRINWRPYVMGAVMKVTGRQPLVQIPMINDYSARDLARVARFHDIEFNIPSLFPVSSVTANRTFYWVRERYGDDPASRLAKAIFRAYFIDDVNIAEASAMIEIATQCGYDGKKVTAALQNEDIKVKVREETDKAIARHVFGSPFFIVDDEPFWGHDRLNHVESWITSGGW